MHRKSLRVAQDIVIRHEPRGVDIKIRAYKKGSQKEPWILDFFRNNDSNTSAFLAMSEFR